MVHAGKKAKQKLRKKSKGQLIALIMYVLTILAVSNPRAYRSAEKRLGLTGKLSKKKRSKKKRKSKTKRKRKSRRKKGRKSKKMSPALKRFLKRYHRFPRKGELR